MIAISLEPELERQLAELAQRLGESVDEFARRAIIERIEDDFHDLAAADKAMRDYDPAKNMSLAEMRRELGLDD